MRKLITIPGTAALSGLLMLSLSAGAWAGGDRHYRGDRDYGHSRGGHSYSHKHHHDRYPARHHSRPKRHHRSNDDELLIGLLVGGLVGYAVGNTQNQVDRYDVPRREPYPTTRYDEVYQHDTCLQEREYQTRVMVGGKQVEAYGTACLQPDGSWRRGPAQVADW